jgi:hypothetical protein
MNCEQARTQVSRREHKSVCVHSCSARQYHTGAILVPCIPQHQTLRPFCTGPAHRELESHAGGPPTFSVWQCCNPRAFRTRQVRCQLMSTAAYINLPCASHECMEPRGTTRFEMRRACQRQNNYKQVGRNNACPTSHPLNVELLGFEPRVTSHAGLKQTAWPSS